jgi:anti-sigma B factor antagonist
MLQSRSSRATETLTLTILPERAAVRVRPAGELDMASAPALEVEITALRDAGFKQIVLDLRELEFMDSSGLQLLLALDAEARQDGFNLSLVRGPAAVQRVFELTGMAGALPFVDA